MRLAIFPEQSPYTGKVTTNRIDCPCCETNNVPTSADFSLYEMEWPKITCKICEAVFACRDKHGSMDMTQWDWIVENEGNWELI